MKYNSFNINMVYSICMCYKLQSICNDPILLICYIHGACLLSLLFQKYYTLVSNQNTGKFTIKIHRDNLRGIGIYNTEEQLQNQQKNSNIMKKAMLDVNRLSTYYVKRKFIWYKKGSISMV